MCNQSTFHLCGSHTVARYIDDIVHTTSNPIITIFIPTATIPSKVIALVLIEIGLLKSIMVSIQRAHLPGPRFLHGKNAIYSIALNMFARLCIKQDRLNSKKRKSCRSGFKWSRSRKRGNEDTTCLRLPPGIDNWATLLARISMIPAPGFRIDWFPHTSQNAQTWHIIPTWPLFSRSCNRPDGSGSGVKLINLPFFDHLPIAVGIRIGWYTLEHRGRRPIGQGTIYDIGMPGYPSDICGTKINILLAIIEDIFVSGCGVDHISASRVHHALGLTG